MENSADLKKKQLSETVERLSDESQSHLLGVLETLYFIQNEREIAFSEAETERQ